MLHALAAKNKIDFIYETIDPPSKKKQPTNFAIWNQSNNMILSLLTHFMELNRARSVIHTSKFDKNDKIFVISFSKKKNANAIFQIQKSIATISQRTITVSVYFTKKNKNLRAQLDSYKSTSTSNQIQTHNKEKKKRIT